MGFATLGAWRPVLTFGIAVAVAPWQDLMVDAGLRLTLYTLSMLGLLAACLLHMRGHWQAIVIHRLWWPLAVFLLWALAWSLIQLPHPSNAQVAGGVMRSPTIRPLVQVGSLVLTLLPVLTAPFLLSSRDELLRLGQVFLASVTALVLLGWWQLFMVYATGHNPLPMGAVNAWLGGLNGVARNAIDLDQNGRAIYRMNSLGGEPRFLAQSIATALLLLQIGWMSRRLRVEKFGLILFAGLFVALLATQAMSGLYLWALGALVLAVYFVRQGRTLSRQAGWGLAGVTAAGVVLLLLASQHAPEEGGLMGALSYLLQRITRRGLIADFDAVVLDFLKAEPANLWFGVGLGNVHLHADAYLSPYFREFAGGTSFVADSGWLRLVSELGLVGLGVFLAWCRQIWVALSALRTHPEWGGSVAVLMPVFLIAAVGYLARGTTYAPVAFILIAAAVVPVFAAGRRV
jgi:hypothetical protein